MGLPIRLSDVELDHKAIDAVLAQLKRHGMTAMGEDKSIDLAVSKDILNLALD